MYTPGHFSETHPALLARLIADHPLATVVCAGVNGPEVNVLPLLLSGDAVAEGCLIGHVAAANPLALADGREVTVVFHGPDAYVSPNWYPTKALHHKAVPTWNYALVEVRGRLQVFAEPTRLDTVLRTLTERFEATQPQPWSLDDAPADFRAAMYKAIVGIEIRIGSIAGKFKLSQNRSTADIEGVMQGLRRGGSESQQATADWMQALGALSSKSDGGASR
ncbi:FMN-binding negative transcriptional regulator [Chitinimonas sp. BJYL2]|uniref:FMN-binding negative transcriptional regulator n=1 Tax=Chitinimonas sp. BJYL2 TaxID=2976696 RepID=UPI0022B45771|nr:FMN-binding negative transcriptional regulator [Chitinimonas sp. BJYL2]